MFKKKERLSRQDFSHFFSIATRFHTPHATILYAPHSQFHAAVVVSKKVAKQAVSRNLLRRKIYGALFRARHLLPIGVYIVLLKPSIASLTTQSQNDVCRSLVERMSKTT
jgi:ribonuclease P protein component